MYENSFKNKTYKITKKIDYEEISFSQFTVNIFSCLDWI